MIGKTLSHFVIREKIGEGGMGIVYKAEDVELQREIALKVLRPEFVEDPERRARFLREARAAAKVSHPNIATIHEVGEAEGETFIAMELVEGDSVRELLRGGAFSLARTLSLALQITGGLEAAHRRQVIHRDLKPENIVVDAEGRAKILDFGLARLIELQEPEVEDRDSADETVSGFLTREGRILGTVAYMSPEQARGLPVDARSDLFSLGITIYEMATGRAPFHGETPSDTLASILREDPPPLTDVHPEIPAELARIVAKCLAKRPDDRYPSAHELQGDLRRLWSGLDLDLDGSMQEALALQSGSGELAAPRVGSSRGTIGARWRWALGIGGAFVLAALTVLVVQFLRSPDSGPGGESGGEALAVMPFQNLKDPDDPDHLGQILQELIITDLSDLSLVSVLSSQRLFDLRKELEGAGGPTFGRETATRIADAAGARTMLEGTVSQLGEKWVLTAQLIDVRSGTVIRSERADGTDLYAVADELAARLRTSWRPAAGEVREVTSVRQKTTSSLEAYRLFLNAADLMQRESFRAAADTLRQACALDPAFGAAYLQSALALWWAPGNREANRREAQEVLTHLLENRLYSSPRERLLAEAALALVSGDWERSTSLYREVTVQHPEDEQGWYGLGEALFQQGTPQADQEATSALEQAIELAPSLAVAHRRLSAIEQRRGSSASQETGRAH
jgi:TolB-like protein/tRNA A-37 threonylcarbamoyl transferase component Bud32